MSVSLSSARLEMELSSYRSAVLADSPMGYWRLGEDTGATVAVDEQGVNDGSYSGGVTLRQAGPKTGSLGVLFDGATGKISVPHAASINPSTAMSVECWVEPQNSASVGMWVQKFGSGAAYWYIRQTNATTVGISVNSDTTSVTYAVIGSSDYNVWTHIVLTYDGASVRLYKNGILVGGPTASTGIAANTGPLTFGFLDNGSGGTQFFSGSMCEVALYSTALSQARITAHYAAGFVDVYADTRASVPVRFHYGIDGSSLTDRVASPGSLTFALDNSTSNSGGLLGYYAPGHANCRSGFALGINVRLILVYGGVEYYKFFGRLGHIQPTPGQHLERTTLCTVFDWMDEAARAKLKRVAIQIDQRADEILTTLVDAMPRQPVSRTFGTGLETYPYALDGSPEEVRGILNECQKIALSEVGNIYVKGNTAGGGELVFESRTDRATKNTNLATFDNTMRGLGASISRDDIISRLQVVTHPKRKDTSDQVLFTLRDTTVSTDSTISIGAGETKDTLVCPYTDPADRNHRIGGTSMVNPVATTDYLLNASADGSGTDLTANLSVSVTFAANAAFVSLTNTGGASGFVTFLQLRGRGIYDEQDVISEATSSTAEDDFGEQAITYDMPYQSDPDVGAGASRYFLALLESQAVNLDAPMVFAANTSSTLMTQALVREPGDRIGLAEAATGLTTMTGFFIQSCEGELAEGGILTMGWGLTPASYQAFWLVGVAGSSELDQTTRVGF